jgi:lipoate-protein ligase A
LAAATAACYRLHVARPVDLIVDEPASPRASLATDDVLRRRALASGRPALRVWRLAGDVLSLGRWHRTPAGGGGVRLLRRATGGRVVPAGAGFVGVSIALPHAAALVADDPRAFAPTQIPNRCVRGILAAWLHAGVALTYPGRDVVTLRERLAGMVTFDVDAAGSCLFEAVLAVGRDFALLPALLDRADPRGIVRAPMLVREHVTSLAQELGGEPSFAQVVDWLGAGYAERLALRVERRELDAAERADVAATAETYVDGRWLAERLPRPELDRSACAESQLGFAEVHCAVAAGRLAEVVLAGDLIADAPAVARIEAALRGLQPEATAVAAAVDGVLADARHFVLGMGPRPGAAVGDLVARACRG